MKNSKFWEMKQESPDTLELYIYSTVESDSWWKESETSAAHFRDMLAQHKDAKEIKVYINSLGGSVMEGIAIYNQLKRHTAHKTVIVDGFACSIASVIAMAGDTVIMPKNTVMMVHNAWTIAMGNSAELRKAADDLDIINQASRQAYIDKSAGKITEEKLTELLDAETYLTAEQCVEYGFADKFAEDEPQPDADAQEKMRGQIAQQLAADAFAERKEKAIAAINKYFG